MNTNEPRDPDQNPDQAETTRLPDTPATPPAAPTAHPAAENAGAHTPPTAATPPAAPTAAATEREERRRKARPILIGAGAAAAVLLLGGGGIAIGAALSDDDEDDQVSLTNSESSPGVQSDDSGQSAAPGDDDAEDESGSGSGGTAGTVPADAAALTEAIDAAIAEANGEGATAIDVERDGYDVDVQLADGSELEVRVALDGAATAREGDSDTDEDPLLDTSKIGDIIDAALGEAGGGTIESISTDTGSAAYEVTVDMGNGDDTDIDLDTNLQVLNVDRD